MMKETKKAFDKTLGIIITISVLIVSLGLTYYLSTHEPYFKDITICSDNSVLKVNPVNNKWDCFETKSHKYGQYETIKVKVFP